MRNLLTFWNRVSDSRTSLRSRSKHRNRGVMRRRLHCEVLEDRRMLAQVTTHLDVVSPTDEVVSFGQAIRDAIAGEVVTFAATLSGKTINVAENFGDFLIDESLTIDASMLLAGITIQAFDPDLGQPNEIKGNGSRIFDITDPFGVTVVTMKGLTLTGGDIGGETTAEGGETIGSGLEPQPVHDQRELRVRAWRRDFPETGQRRSGHHRQLDLVGQSRGRFGATR